MKAAAVSDLCLAISDATANGWRVSFFSREEDGQEFVCIEASRDDWFADMCEMRAPTTVEQGKAWETRCAQYLYLVARKPFPQ